MRAAMRDEQRLQRGQQLPGGRLRAGSAAAATVAHVSEAMSETEYEARALPELAALVRSLDAIEDDAFEAELASDILTIEFTDGSRYVVNSHRAARQIWMAAERNAWHFDWVFEKNAWVAQKTGDELWAALSRVLSTKLGRPLTLAREP